jgi:probable addiction module antidote protein
MGKLATRPFDAAEYLDSEESVAEYLTEALDSEDGAFVAHALGVVARSRRMSRIARAAGVGRESLYKSLSKTGNPEFSTVLKVVHALGLKLAVEPQRRRELEEA